MIDHEFVGVAQSIQGQEISWAGRSPWTGSLCYGTDQGVLMFAPRDGDVAHHGYTGRKCLDDSINGVAFSGDFVAVSGRGSVSVRRRWDDDQPSALHFIGEMGSHQIVSRSNGGFIATLGVDGLLLIDVQVGGINRTTRFFSEEPTNFYRLAPLGRQGNQELFACAARDSGLLVVTLIDGNVNPPIIGQWFPGIDAVDICPLGSPGNPRAIAALNIDGVLFLSKDLSGEANPLALQFNVLGGVGYTIICAQGHLIVLTDTGLVVIPNLANEFLAGKPLTEDVPLTIVSIPASEIFLADENTLIALVDGKAVAYEIADLANNMNNPLVVQQAADLQDGSGPVTMESTLSRPIMFPHPDWQATKLHPTSTAA